MYIILEKHYFERDAALHFLINKKRIPKDIRSVCVDLQIGSSFTKMHSEIIEMVLPSLNKKFPPDVEIILADTVAEDQQQNSIAIVGYD